LEDTAKLFPPTEPLASTAEIVYTISQAPNNKAAGTDNHTAELLKPVAPKIAKWLFLLFNAIQRVGITPTEWIEVTLIALWKGKGTPDDPSQHRPISLTQHFRKIFERCIMPTLLTQAGPLDKAQGGFRKQRGTTQQIVAFHIMTKNQIELSGEPQHWMAFLDIKAAYDTVWQEKRWEILARRGVEPSLLKVIQSLFDRCTAKVNIKGSKSAPFWFMLGLLQGSVLSPSLFNYFIDNLPQ
jgi:hypothetical protein